MKISELIEELEIFKKIHGDVVVVGDFLDEITSVYDIYEYGHKNVQCKICSDDDIE